MCQCVRLKKQYTRKTQTAYVKACKTLYKRLFFNVYSDYKLLL
nr:MAG TPA: hypothetical protein [Caudoviricetes sp.]